MPKNVDLTQEELEQIRKNKAKRRDSDLLLAAALSKKKIILEEKLRIEDEVRREQFSQFIKKITKLSDDCSKHDKLDILDDTVRVPLRVLFKDLTDARAAGKSFADDADVKAILDAIDIRLDDPVMLAHMSKLEENKELERIAKTDDISSDYAQDLTTAGENVSVSFNDMPSLMTPDLFNDYKNELKKYITKVLAEKTARNTAKALIADLEGEEREAAVDELKNGLLSKDSISKNAELLEDHPGINSIMSTVKNKADIKKVYKMASENDANDLVKELARKTEAAVRSESANMKTQNTPQKTFTMKK